MRVPIMSWRLSRMPRFRSEVIAPALAVLVLGGCASVEVPDDRVTFIVNGQGTSVAMTGSISVAIQGVPELTYSGPSGCAGQYFADPESDVYFRYTARRAYFLRGSRLYTFEGPPRRRGDLIVWSHTFGADRISILANCQTVGAGSSSS